MNILPDRRGQVYQFISRQLDLQRKRINVEFLFKIPEAGDALHPHPHPDPPGREEPPVAHADIQRIAQWGHGSGAGFHEPERPGVFLPFDMQCFPLRNLATMDFHGLSNALTRTPPQVNAQS